MTILSDAKMVWESVYFQLFQSKASNDPMTYVYQQCADNLGHITLGLIPTLILMSLFGGSLLIPIAVLMIWALKEANDFRCAVANNASAGIFPLDKVSLLNDIFCALYYNTLGILLAYICKEYGWSDFTYISIGIMTILSLIQMTFYLKANVYLDKAGIPYLLRLADFSKNQTTGTLDSTLVEYSVDCFMAQVSNNAKANFIIKGDVGTGGSELSIAMANELVISGKNVRYVSFDDVYVESIDNISIDYWTLEETTVLFLDSLPTNKTDTNTDIDHVVGKLPMILSKLKNIQNLVFIVVGNQDTTALSNALGSTQEVSLMV